MIGAGEFKYPVVDILEFTNYETQGPRENSASMKAAANPDPTALQTILARRVVHDKAGDEQAKVAGKLRDTCGLDSTVEWSGQDSINTPWLQAIRSQLP